MNARMLVPFQIILGRLGRRIFLAILAILAVGCLKAEGVYQSTKNGKTMVWNSAPKPGDTATWVGDRNRERYASGFGTLTWYTASGKIFARYYGNMVDGKLDGPVNAHSNGRVAHATFAEGKRISPWTGGAATLRGGFLRGGFAEPKSTPAPQAEAEKPEKHNVVAETRKETRETPAETPKKEVPPPPEPKATLTPVPEPKPIATPEIKRVAEKPSTPPPSSSARPSPELFPTPAPVPTEKRGVDESLQSLVGPPSSLHNTHPAEKNTIGPLTKDEALDLANTVARTHGYDLSSYGEPKVEHNESDEIWSMSYDARENDSGAEGKHLSITVDGKTKRASIAPPEEHKESP
jgi:hypothetical protein